jgi:hypothetical protein
MAALLASNRAPADIMRIPRRDWIRSALPKT